MDRRETRGITLISLVITIIILIILAGIGLNFVLGEGGILQKAREGKEKQKIASIQDKLELEKGDLDIKEQGELDLDKYLAQIQEKGIITEEDIERNHEESVNVTVEDKYVFLVEKEESGNIKIEYLGEAGNLTPKIEIIKVSSTSHNATIEFTLRYASKYRLTIRKEGEEVKETKEGKVEEKKISCTFEELEKDTNYLIKIEAEAEKGAKAEKEQNVTTKTIEGLTEANCTFSYSPDDWTNKTVTATANVSIDIGEYILQTSQDGEHWDNTPSQTLSENGPVYARLIDITEQEGGSTTGNVEKIDKQKPEVTNETTATTNTITIKATDDASGIIGYTVTENKTEPKDFTECTSRKELTIDVGSKKQGTTYYVWVKDDADNISVYKEIKTGTVSTPNITIEKENDWTSSGKSVTLSKVNGYTTKYTTDGSAPSATHGTTYSNAFTISANNTTVKAVYVDSANQVGKIASKVVKNIDLADPTEATITISGDKTQTTLPVTLTAKVTHNDGESGVKIEFCKYKLNTSNAALGTETSKYDTAFSSNGQSITIKPNSVTSWYLHVLTVDNVGRAKETIKGPINIQEKTHQHVDINGTIQNKDYQASSSGGCFTTVDYKEENIYGQCGKSITYRKHTWPNGVVAWGGFCEVHGLISAAMTDEEREKWSEAYPSCDKQVVTGTKKVPTGTYSLGCNKNEQTVEGYTISY